MTGVELETIRRELSACDHAKWTSAVEKLRELRKEAFVLVSPIFKRLQGSLDAELNAAAIAAEHRLDAAGLPIRNGDSWMMHDDAICKALWSQRYITEKTFAVIQERQDGVGAVQWFCSDEEGVPFSWV